ncbi:hypothetical protein HYS92_03095 [Candidatus Daviesbacteria bacterium]|nr:hypothetical protein [Candidatus Daviesbacteria bacterium]
MKQFFMKKPAFEYLRQSWSKKHKNIHNNLWSKHGQTLQKLAVGSLGSLMILSSPPQPILPKPLSIASRDDIIKGFDKNIILAQRLKEKLPPEVGPLSAAEEEEITQILSRDFGFKVAGELEGIRLNRNYGLIGGEQHLYRYPGDNLYQHADNTSDWAKYGGAGIAPGLGAWGYFALSKEQFSEEDKLKERYYLAIQTFLAPGFAENVSKYRDFFQYKKMLVINPYTGQSVVAVIADAGPAEWTGKHLGGSPEVMDYLGLAEGSRKGAVLYFFIDDPQNLIPLGPIKVEGEA